MGPLLPPSRLGVGALAAARTFGAWRPSAIPCGKGLCNSAARSDTRRHKSGGRGRRRAPYQRRLRAKKNKLSALFVLNAFTPSHRQNNLQRNHREALPKYGEEFRSREGFIYVRASPQADS
eukprot:GHVT01070311.1.p1 GENE.GHVT01070311.1~~GHVT01070311.1.p1  ORF type:complete len:121 (+),score=18.47 GHVT01070311.1:553-915(+)